MNYFLFILISLFAFTTQASYQPESRFLVDYEYQCTVSVKDFRSDEYVADPDSDFKLQVGNKREKLFFTFEVGGRWFSLRNMNTNDLMVFGITECTPFNNRIFVDFSCYDRVSYDEIGYGYYWKGSDWKAVTEPRGLPKMINNNLSFSLDLWKGAPNANFRTTVFTDIETDMKERITLWSCERVQ